MQRRVGTHVATGHDRPVIVDVDLVPRRALIDGLFIHEVGDEALHLRTASSDNTVRANTIRRTGLRIAKFGEGIYIGTDSPADGFQTHAILDGWGVNVPCQ